MTATSAETVLSCRRQGLLGCHGADTSGRGACRTGSVILTVKADHRQDDGKGRRRDPARTIRMPPVSSISITVRRWTTSPAHPAGRARETAMPGNIAVKPGCRGPGRRGAGGCGCPERPSPYSGITLSDEGGQGERARTRRYERRSGHRDGCPVLSLTGCSVRRRGGGGPQVR